MGKRKRGRKTPAYLQQPAPGKRPRIADPPESISGEVVVWKLGIFDGDAPWGGGLPGLIAVWQDVRDKLASYESMTWGQIESDKTRNHSVDFDGLSKAAQERLASLNQDDVESLFRFRFTGKQRLWGIREGAAFKILWWDPQHEVCPSKKKHT